MLPSSATSISKMLNLPPLKSGLDILDLMQSSTPTNHSSSATSPLLPDFPPALSIFNLFSIQGSIVQQPIALGFSNIPIIPLCFLLNALLNNLSFTKQENGCLSSILANVIRAR